MQPGHPNWMLDSSRDGRLPRSDARRARHAALVLQPAPPRSAAASRDDARRLLRPRRRERAAPERHAVPRRRAPARAARWRPTSRAGITPSARASSRPTASATSSRTGDGGRSSPLPRHRRRRGRRHRLAADGRLPAPSPARRSTTRSCAPTGSIPTGRSCSSWGTRRRTRPTRGGSSSGWWLVGGGRPRALPAALPASPARQGVARRASSARAAAKASTSRSRASPISRR